MKITNNINRKITHQAIAKPKDVYDKNKGKTPLNKEIFKPLHRNMYK